MIDTQLLLTVLVILLPILYGVALFNYLLVFFTEDRLVRRLARPVFLVAVITNLVYLAAYTVFFEHIPGVTLYQAIGAVGFAVAVVYLWVETRTGTLYTGPFIIAFVLVCKVVNALFPRLDADVPPLLQSTLLSVHVAAAVLGYSAFAVAAVYGALYLLLYRNIRSKTFGLMFDRLPSLDVLDRMNFVAVVAGFVMLTPAIVIGLVWGARAVEGTVWGDPKVLFAILTWFVYGLALIGHEFRSWKGPRLAYSSLVGFGVILFSVLAVNLFLTSFHEFRG